MITKKYKSNLLTIICLFALTFSFAQTQGSRPNVIIILADDLGYGDVGFNRDASFPNDLGVIPTPNIDNLASEGVILKNAHVGHPFCGPSRASLMTGVYPHRIGAQYNLPNDITTTYGIPTDETYFPKILQTSGYNTAAFGKWHLGFTDGAYQPLDRGFDYFFGFLGGGKNYFENIYEDSFYARLGTSNPVTNEYQDPLWRDKAYVAESEFSDAPNEDYVTDLLTDEAIAYATINAPSSDPYFMYLSYNAPHTPLQAPDAEIAQFKLDNPNFEDLVRNSDYIINSNPVTKLPVDEQAAKIEEFVQARITYATMVTNMDANIGRLIDVLDNDAVEYSNTLIIFLSDNGGYTYSKGAVNYPLDALKGSVKEGGHKVPMFVRWPDQITATTTPYNHQISALDLYPTLVNLAGKNLIPAGKTIDGVDFMDKLIVGADAREDGTLLVMRPYNGFHNGGLAMGQWKIVKTGGSGTWKLYNILSDPGETTDLRSSEPNAEQIIQDMLDQTITLVSEFKDVKPAWYDNDGDGSGHPHSFLWDDGTLPGYDRLFESSLLLLDGEIDRISINGITDAVEGEINGAFKVSLPEGVLATENIIVSYTTSGLAIDGTDYTVLSGTVTILNGTNSSNITIVATPDGFDEVSETVTIQLDGTSVGNVDTTAATINIFDVIVPTELTAGDVAIVGWKAGSASLAFMLLKDITATTKLSISNRSWKGSQDGWNIDYAVDDVWTWTAGATFSVGDIFKLDSDGSVKQVNSGTEVVVGSTSHDYTGKIAASSDGDFDLSASGDGILIYQVNPFELPTDPNSNSWIAGLNTNGGWGTNGVGGGNSYCELPTALTNGINAVTVGIDQNYGVYKGKIEGTADQLRESINNSANWISSEDGNYNLWSYVETVSAINGDIGVGGTLSIDNLDMKNSVGVYPNPVTNFTKINISKGNVENVNLYNISGILIRTYKSTSLNLTDIPTGVYFLSIKTTLGVINKKIIKM